MQISVSIKFRFFGTDLDWWIFFQRCDWNKEKENRLGSFLKSIEKLNLAYFNRKYENWVCKECHMLIGLSTPYSTYFKTIKSLQKNLKLRWHSKASQKYAVTQMQTISQSDVILFHKFSTLNSGSFKLSYSPRVVSALFTLQVTLFVSAVSYLLFVFFAESQGQIHYSWICI